MDAAQFPQANALLFRYGSLSTAINLFYTEGTIIGAVTLSGAEQTQAQAAVVDTRAYSFPQEVLDGIEAMMWAQLQDVSNQLAAMGVTGLAPPRSAP